MNNDPVNDFINKALGDDDIEPLLDRMRDSVVTQESGGNQKVRNPRTSATGLFQVIPANIPNWTKKYVGKAYTQDQFANDAKAQEAVFRGEMGKYLRKAKAKGVDDDTAIRMGAAAWYGGEGAMHRYDDPKRFRPNEPSFREYTTSILGRLNKPDKFIDAALASDPNSFIDEALAPKIPAPTIHGTPMAPPIDLPINEAVQGSPVEEATQREAPYQQWLKDNNYKDDRSARDSFNAEQKALGEQASQEDFRSQPGYQKFSQWASTEGIDENDPTAIEAYNKYASSIKNPTPADFGRAVRIAKLQKAPNQPETASSEIRVESQWSQDPNGDVVKEGYDAAAQQLANKAQVSFETAKQFLTDPNEWKGGLLDENDLKYWKSKGRPATWNIDAEALKKLKARQAEADKRESSLKFRQDAIDPNLPEIDKDIERFRLQLEEDATTGKITTEQALTALNKLKKDVEAFRNDRGLTGIFNQEDWAKIAPDWENLGRGIPAPGVNKPLEFDRMAKTPEDARRIFDKAYADIRSKYGSVSNYVDQSKAFVKKYKDTPNVLIAKALETTAGGAVKAPLKGASALLKSIGIASEAVSKAFGGTTEAKDIPAFKIGKDLENLTEEIVRIDPDFKHGNSELFGDVLGQVGTQILIGAATGGALAPALFGAALGASAQYDEATKRGATGWDRLGSAAVGGALAASDYVIFRNWFKGASAVERAGFLSRLKTNIRQGLEKKGVISAEQKATQFTDGFFAQMAKESGVKGKVGRVGQVAANRTKEGFKEAGQEAILEAKGNDLYAYMTYDPSPARLKRLTSVTGENITEAIAGFLGGVAGSTVGEIVSKAETLSDDDLRQASTIVSTLPKDNVANIAEAFSKEANRRKIKLDELSPQPAQMETKPLVSDQSIEVQAAEVQDADVSVEKIPDSGTQSAEVSENVNQDVPNTTNQDIKDTGTNTGKPPLTRIEKAGTKKFAEMEFGKTPVQRAVELAKKKDEQLKQERRKVDTNPKTGLGSDNAWKAAQKRIEADPNQAIISLDVNRMKDANDTTSHDTVDEKVLKRLGEVTTKVLEVNGIDTRNAFTPGGDELYVAVPPKVAKKVRDQIEKEFGTVEIIAEKDVTNDRTGEKFSKGDVIPVTLAGTYGQTLKVAEKGLNARKAESKAKNPVRRVPQNPVSQKVGQKKPYEMTAEEWQRERDNVRPNIAQSNLTKASGSEAIARANRLAEILGDVRKVDQDLVNQYFADQKAGKKSKITDEQVREAIERINEPVRHRDVVESALKSGDLTSERAKELGHYESYPELEKDFPVEGEDANGSGDLAKRYDDIGGQLAKIQKGLVFRDFVSSGKYTDYLADSVPGHFPPEIKEHNRLYKERDDIASRLNDIADQNKGVDYRAELKQIFRDRRASGEELPQELKFVSGRSDKIFEKKLNTFVNAMSDAFASDWHSTIVRSRGIPPDLSFEPSKSAREWMLGATLGAVSVLHTGHQSPQVNIDQFNKGATPTATASRQDDTENRMAKWGKQRPSDNILDLRKSQDFQARINGLSDEIAAIEARIENPAETWPDADGATKEDLQEEINRYRDLQRTLQQQVNRPTVSDNTYYEIAKSARQKVLDTIYDQEGNLNYEQIQNAVNRVFSGEYRIERLAPEGEAGRIAGGGLLVGASLVVGGKTSADTKGDSRKRRNQEEELLEAYAKEQGAWVDDIDAFKQGLGRVGRGMEAEAFEDPADPNYVIKIAPIPYFADTDSTLLQFFDDKIALHNTLPYTVPYELVGFTRDLNTQSSSTFQAILRQPYIKGRETTGLDNAFAKQMQTSGFVLDYTGSRFTGNGLEVLDVTTHNVIEGEDGNFYIFDPMVAYRDADQYQAFDVAESDSPTFRRRDEFAEYGKDFANAMTLPPSELLPLTSIKKNVVDSGDGHISIEDIPDFELIRRTIGSYEKKYNPNYVPGISFDGLFLDSAQVKKYVQTLKDLAREAKDNGADARPLLELADIVKKASTDGVIFTLADEALPEEKGHRALFRNRIENRQTQIDNLDTLHASEPVQRALKSKLGRNYKGASKGVQLEEFVVKTLIGDYSELGAKTDAHQREAIGVAIEFIESFAEKNKGEKTKEQILNDLAKEIGYTHQVREQFQQRSEGAKGNDTDSGVEPSEGTEDRRDPESTEEASQKVKNRKHAEYLRKHGLDVEDVPYIPETERGWQEKGREIVNKSLSDKGDYSDAIKEFETPKNISGGERTALGYELIDRLGSEGDYDAMRKIAEGVVVHEGNAGAILRAAQIVSKYDFAKAVELTTKALNKQGKSLTDEQIDKLREAASKYAATEEELATAIEMFETARSENERLANEIAEIDSALKESDQKREINETLIKQLRRQVSYWKNKKIAESRPRRTAVYKELSDKREAILAKIREAYGDEVAKSVRDQTDTPAFKKWFGDSKVVDENGEPLVVYHGTPKSFDVFEERFIGTHGTGEGQGFYFTDNRDFALGYGPSMEVFLKIEKPLSPDRKTITKAQFKAILRKVDPTGDDYLSNWGDVGYEGYERVLNEAVNNEYADAENDVDLAGGLFNAGVTFEQFQKASGYDGSITKGKYDNGQAIYVIFNTRNVKSAIGNSGAFDPNEDSILKSARTTIDEDTRNALVDYTALKVLEHTSYEDVIDDLRSITGLPDAEIHSIHADAIESITAKSGQKQSPEVKDMLRMRAEHKREARRFRDGGLDLNRLDREVLKDAKDAKLVFATLLWNRALSATDFKTQIKKEFPDMTNAEINSLLVDVGQRREKAKHSLKKQSFERKADKELSDTELKTLESEKRIRSGLSRKAKQSLDRTMRDLTRNAAQKVADGVMEGINFLKGTQATGEVSYILRQGLLPLITDTRLAIKGLEGVPQGLRSAEHSAEFIEKIREHSRFNEAQAFGIRFSEIGDFNIADEHFSSKLLGKIPLYKRLELAYTLPGDMQRLFIYDAYASVIETQGLSEAEEVKAKKYAAKVANALTGKGDIGTILAKGGAVSKLANTLFFSPSLLVSRFQSMYYLTGGFATAPKGMRMQMAKKGARAYSVLLLTAALIGMSLDPDDDDFLKVRPKKGSLLADVLGEDVQLNPLAGMDLPLELVWRNTAAFARSVKTGDWGHFTDSLSETWQKLGTNKNNEPRFFRGKLSPSASWVVDYATGTDYIGRPYTHWGAATSRLIPLSWGQTYDALFYDRHDAMMKEPATLERAQERGESNLHNMLSVMIPTFIGIGVNQYPEMDRTPALKKASEMADYISKKDRELVRIEGGLRAIIKDKLRLQAEGKSTIEAERALKKYSLQHADILKTSKQGIKGLTSQAKSTTGLLSFYAKDLNVDQLNRVLPLTNDEERKVIEKLIKSKSAKTVR